MTKKQCQDKAKEIRARFNELAQQAITPEEITRNMNIGEKFAQVWDRMADMQLG